MILTSQGQQTILAIPSFLINLLSTTVYAYHKMLRLKAHSDNLKKYLSSILDYAGVKLFHPPML